MGKLLPIKVKDLLLSLAQIEILKSFNYLLVFTNATQFLSHALSLCFRKQPSSHGVFEGDLDPNGIIQRLAFILDSDIDATEDFLVFDEVQECPRALTSLKYFSEEKPTLTLIAAGSLLGLERPKTSFPLGKVTFLDLAPLSFEEFLLGIQDTRSLNFLESLTPETPFPEVIHAHLWTQWKKYLVVGGLPEVVTTFNEHQSNLFEAAKRVRAKQNQSYIA